MPSVTSIKHWIQSNESLLQLLGSLSLMLFIFTLVALVFIVITLPEDYFTRDHRESSSLSQLHPLPWRILALLKNLLGGLFILIGIALLILPGQGALTILLGLTMTNFPGKYRLERFIVSRQTISKTLNQIRRRAHRAPLQLPAVKRQLNSRLNRS